MFGVATFGCKPATSILVDIQIHIIINSYNYLPRSFHYQTACMQAT